MKLIELQLEGFTAFREPTVLDLSEADLFAITGPTGAGKTSLLDGVTYALFGIVERVGREVGHLISQNRAALKVLLTFEVSGERYRVTRRRPRKGAVTVLLERSAGEEGWVNVGEGADRVEGVNARIEQLLGLDYDGFTRAVLLPQGQFAEFLQGEKAARRNILSKLLGLERIAELGAAAREASKSLKSIGDAKAEIANGSLADATPEILKQKRRELEDARFRSERLEQLGASLDALSARSADVMTERADLVRAQAALDECGSRIRSATGERDSAISELRSAQEADQDRAGEEAKLVAAHELAREMAQEHAKAFGSDTDLEQALSLANAWQGNRKQLLDLTSRLDKGAVLISEAKAELDAVQGRVKASTEKLAELESRLDAAQQELDEAKRADHAAAACEGLSAGDACPICATKLALIPIASFAARSASSKVEGCRAKIISARKESETDFAARATLTERLTALQSHSKDLEADLAPLRATVERATTELEGWFPDGLPAQPADVLEVRMAERRKHSAELAKASDALSSAKLASVEAQKRIAKLEVHVEHATKRLEDARDPKNLAALKPLEITLPALVGEEELQNLAAHIQARRTRLETVEAQMLQEARDAAGDHLGMFASVADAIDLLTETRRGAERSLGASEEAIRLLEKRIEERIGLQKEIEQLGHRADRFDELGRLLKGNEFIAWLQEDALRALCRAGTEHLRRLSGDRYRLELDPAKDEFVVHDTWNGDEPRSARTLSGGETYLASLALALSLADEVARMRIDASVRLETLLLDEGFGSLDHDSLDEVVEAIELLAASGRSVGVITHIEELAQRMPVRFMVLKHETGSVIERIQ